MASNAHAARRIPALVVAVAAGFCGTPHLAHAQVPKVETVTAIASPVCALYRGGSVDLLAKLTELVGGLPVGGQVLDFTVGGSAAGSASTDASGFASQPFAIDGLMAGDYALKAEFLGDAAFNGSSDTGLLGISYTLVGFLPPLNGRGSPTAINHGRVLPVKIQLVDADLDPVTTASPKVWIHKWTPGNGLGERLAAPTSASAANIGNAMRYSSMDQHYIFNWDTRNLPRGSYAVVVEPGDSAACSDGPYYATVTVGKKGK